MHVLPSRERQVQLGRFFDRSQPAYGGVVVIDEDDESYAGFELPAGWRPQWSLEAGLAETRRRWLAARRAAL